MQAFFVVLLITNTGLFPTDIIAKEEKNIHIF